MFFLFRRELFCFLFIYLALGFFLSKGRASSEDYDGLNLALKGVRLLSHHQPTVLRHLVVDDKVGLPYEEMLTGEQAHLDDLKDVVRPHKKVGRGIIFKPCKKKPSVDPASYGSSFSRGSAPLLGGPSLRDSRVFIGNLTKTKGRSRGATCSQIPTTLSQQFHGDGAPINVSEKIEIHAQHFEEGMLISTENQSHEEKEAVRPRNTLTIPPSTEGALDALRREEKDRSRAHSTPLYVEGSDRVSSKVLEQERRSPPNTDPIDLKAASSGQVRFSLGSEPSLSNRVPSSKKSEEPAESSVTPVGPLLTTLFHPESYSVGSLGEKVANPTIAPWSAIAHLRLTLEDIEGNPMRTYVGTGFVIDIEPLASMKAEDATAFPKNCYLISAAHNLYLRAYNTGVSRIEIYPGLSAEAVYAKSIADLYIVHPAYVESEGQDYKQFDIAIIKVPQPFGDSIAKMPIKVFSKEDLEKALVEIWGYPAMVHEKMEGSSNPLLKALDSKTMYKMNGKILEVSDNQLLYDASTYPGQSGSPVVINGSISGVHTYGGNSPEDGNCGTRISSETLDLLWHWIQTLEEESGAGDDAGDQQKGESSDPQ